MARPTARLRRLASVLLAVEALLLVTPVLAISDFFQGAALVGKAVAYVRVVDVVLQGIAQLLLALGVLLLLLAAHGVVDGARGFAALLLQPWAAAMVAVPALRPALTLDVLPFGVWLTGSVVLGTTAALVALVWTTRGGAASPKRPARARRRLLPLAAFAAAAATVAALGAGDRTLPNSPVEMFLSRGGADPVALHPARAPVPPQNPGLAADPWNSIHNDSWGTDSYRLPAPADPMGAAVESVFTGGDCATITFDSRGRLVTLCSTLGKVLAYVIDPESLSVLAQQEVGSRSPNPTDFSSGGYFVLDAADRIVFAGADGAITLLSTGTTQPRIETVARHDVSAWLQPGERITSLMPQWRGGYWFVGGAGTVGLLDRDGRMGAVDLGEGIGNSLAVSRAGAYVVTDSALYRLRRGADGAPRVVWRSGYDAGVRRKPGQTSRGSGTTPTVFAGGRKVAITDNAEPRMHVAVFDTATGRRICSVPVFESGASATENALIAAGRLLVVENNYGYAPAVTATTGGHTTAGGLAAVSTGGDGCRLRWQRGDLHIPSVVSKASLTSGVVLTYTKPPSPLGADGWYFTAVGLRTGATAWRRLAGSGTPFNNHYAAAYLGPRGDMFVGTANGIVVLRNR